jgi:hypothetical protein
MSFGASKKMIVDVPAVGRVGYSKDSTVIVRKIPAPFGHSIKAHNDFGVRSVSTQRMMSS